MKNVDAVGTTEDEDEVNYTKSIDVKNVEDMNTVENAERP